MSKELTKLKQKVDRAMQDYYRREHKGFSCELCSQPYQVAHHHVPKSRSNYLRYEYDNLVFLCNGCHRKIHQGDPGAWNKLMEVRGKEWSERIEKEGHKQKSWKMDELKNLLNNFTK